MIVVGETELEGMHDIPSAITEATSKLANIVVSRRMQVYEREEKVGIRCKG